MSKWWHYPKWRRTVLQIVTWALLGATLGMAGILTAQRRGKDFSPPIAAGPFGVRVPAGWKVKSQPAPNGVLAVGAMEFMKPARTVRQPRTVDFFVKTLTAPATLQDFLAETGLVQTSSEAIGGDDDGEQAQIAGYDVTEFIQPSVRIVGGQVTSPTTEYFAGVQLPDGTALTVKFVCDGPPNPRDQQMFLKILDRITAEN